MDNTDIDPIHAHEIHRERGFSISSSNEKDFTSAAGKIHCILHQLQHTGSINSYRRSIVVRECPDFIDEFEIWFASINDMTSSE